MLRKQVGWGITKNTLWNLLYPSHAYLDTLQTQDTDFWQETCMNGHTSCVPWMGRTSQHQAGNCCLRSIGFKIARQHLCWLDHTFLVSENLHWVKGISSCMLKDFLRAGNWILQALQVHVLPPVWPQLYLSAAVLQVLSVTPQEHSAALLPFVQWQW